LGAIATAAMILRYSAKREQEARSIEQAIIQVLEAGYRTADLKRGAGERLVNTEEMGRLVMDAIGAAKSRPAHA
jgi:3-isopropylmalate dehydrogenase